MAHDSPRLGARFGVVKSCDWEYHRLRESRRAIREPGPTKTGLSLVTTASPAGRAPRLLALIQLMDPINQIVIAGCASHDRIELEEPFIFGCVIESHARLSRVVPKYNFVPMDGLDL